METFVSKLTAFWQNCIARQTWVWDGKGMECILELPCFSFSYDPICLLYSYSSWPAYWSQVQPSARSNYQGLDYNPLMCYSVPFSWNTYMSKLLRCLNCFSLWRLRKNSLSGLQGSSGTDPRLFVFPTCCLLPILTNSIVKTHTHHHWAWRPLRLEKHVSPVLIKPLASLPPIIVFIQLSSASLPWHPWSSGACSHVHAAPDF